MAAETRSSEFVVTDALAGLVAERDKGYFYAANPELDRRVQRLVAAYTERPTTVIKTIISSPSNKIRNFANAFRFRRD